MLRRQSEKDGVFLLYGRAVIALTMENEIRNEKNLRSRPGGGLAAYRSSETMLMVGSTFSPARRLRAKLSDAIVRRCRASNGDALRSCGVSELAVFRTNGVADEAEVQCAEQLADEDDRSNDRLDPLRLPL